MDAPISKPLIVTESFRRSQEQRDLLWEGKLQGLEQRLSKTNVPCGQMAQGARGDWEKCGPAAKSTNSIAAATPVTFAPSTSVSTSSASSTTPSSTSSPKSANSELTESVIIAERVKKRSDARADLFEARLKLAEKRMGRETKDEPSMDSPPKPVMPKLQDIEDDVFEPDSDSEEDNDCEQTMQVCR
ncbi:hypothetical protein IAT38_004446 [Cryptococcus sp. DSM 104549]